MKSLIVHLHNTTKTLKLPTAIIGYLSAVFSWEASGLGIRADVYINRPL